jgi:hypothetical protein
MLGNGHRARLAWGGAVRGGCRVRVGRGDAHGWWGGDLASVLGIVLARGDGSGAARIVRS